jgi:hypothetical protein
MIEKYQNYIKNLIFFSQKSLFFFQPSFITSPSIIIIKRDISNQPLSTHKGKKNIKLFINFIVSVDYHKKATTRAT